MPDLGYEPIDIGDGRRLERFGPVVVDRPAPAGSGPRLDPSAWQRAIARFDPPGRWSFVAPLPDPWRLELGDLVLELRAASAGQVGVFPEQSGIWSAAARWVEGARGRGAAATIGTGDAAPASPRVLSLFGYTGAATLACARAGGEVVHVDASRTAVTWARRNAELSGLAHSRIRWIAEDARTFVAREARRERRYDAVLLDPPSYGHGPAGSPWRIDRDLGPLVAALSAVLDPAGFVLLTAHTPGFTADRLGCLLESLGAGAVDGGPLELVASSGARLGLGAWASWTGR